MTTTETTSAAPATVKYCFSGSGRMANRKWAPGGDATYLSRLRRAHLAQEDLPDPWFIQDNGGIEANAPEGGWPKMSPMEIAVKLDAERGAGASPHWVHTLDRAAQAAADKNERRSARDRVSAERRKEREAERAAQEARPKEGEVGEYQGKSATVLRRLDPERILITVEGGSEELIYDEQFARVNAPTPEAAPADEGEFVEQQ